MPYDTYHITEIEVTYPNKEEAHKMAFVLLEERLIACAHFTQVESIFPWEGRVDEVSEVRANFKTIEKFTEQVKDIVNARHSYDIPMIVTNHKTINEEYFRWMERVCGE